MKQCKYKPDEFFESKSPELSLWINVIRRAIDDFTDLTASSSIDIRKELINFFFKDGQGLDEIINACGIDIRLLSGIRAQITAIAAEKYISLDINDDSRKCVLCSSIKDVSEFYNYKASSRGRGKGCIMITTNVCSTCKGKYKSRVEETAARQDRFINLIFEMQDFYRAADEVQISKACIHEWLYKSSGFKKILFSKGLKLGDLLTFKRKVSDSSTRESILFQRGAKKKGIK